MSDDAACRVVIEALERRVLLSAATSGGISGQVLEIPTFMSPPAGLLVGWRVFVDLNRNGRADAREPSAVTDGSGGYEISGLRPGRYRVAADFPAGWVPADGRGRKWEVVRVRGGQVSGTNNFGAARVLGNATASIQAVVPGTLVAGAGGRIALRVTNDLESPTVTGRFDISLLVTPAGSISDAVPLARVIRTLTVPTGQARDVRLTVHIPRAVAAGSYVLSATVVPHGASEADGIVTPGFGPVAVRSA